MRLLEICIQGRSSPSWGESWKKKDSILICQSAYSALYTESTLLVSVWEISNTKMCVWTRLMHIWLGDSQCYRGTLCNTHSLNVFPFSNYPEKQTRIRPSIWIMWIQIFFYLLIMAQTPCLTTTYIFRYVFILAFVWIMLSFVLGMVSFMFIAVTIILCFCGS